MNQHTLCAFLFCILSPVISGHAHYEKKVRHHSRENPLNETICVTALNDDTPLSNSTASLQTTTFFPGTLRIYTNASVNVVAAVNVTSGITFILDVNNNISAFFNVSSGAVIILNYQTNIGYFVGPNSNVSQENFQTFFARINLVLVYNQAARLGTRFTTQQISLQITQELIIFLRAFGVYLTRSQSAVAIWAEISVRWSAGLRGFLIVIEGEVTEFRESILRIVLTFQGIREFFLLIRVDVSVLIQAGVKLDLAKIINSGSSRATFLYIISVLRQSNIAITSNNSTIIFGLIAAVSGNSTRNVSGIITIIAQIIAVSQNQTNISVLIRSLVAYYVNNNGFSVSIELVIEDLTNFRNSVRAVGLDQAADHIDLFISRRLVINGVDVYAFIKILVQANSVPIGNIAQILVIFQGVVTVEISIGELYVVLFYVLESVHSRVAISILLGVEIQIPGIFGTVLEYILGDIRNFIIRLEVLLQDLDDYLSRTRIFKQITAAIDKGLARSSNRTVREIVARPKFRLNFIARIIQLFRTILRDPFFIPDIVAPGPVIIGPEPIGPLPSTESKLLNSHKRHNKKARNGIMHHIFYKKHEKHGDKPSSHYGYDGKYDLVEQYKKEHFAKEKKQ